jgi:aspartyl/asparaginyl-tRNA synthetase
MNQQPLSSYQGFSTYHETLARLRAFFLAKNYIEIDTQSRRSILAACEDPKTISTYTMSGTTWPLPQTGQMWLEYELLKHPDAPGVFCSTTSYRDEPNPIPERHLKMFPMFEFESHGAMTDLQKLLKELVEHLGFGDSSTYHNGRYSDVAKTYSTHDLTASHELQIWKDHGPVFFLTHFPLYTHPFFNMKQEGEVAHKIDTLLYGVETIGAAERSTNVEQMREQFYTISEGQYSQTLFNLFGRERVEKELEEFLSLNFFPRFGGGIGVNRLMRALQLRLQELPEGMFQPAHSLSRRSY